MSKYPTLNSPPIKEAVIDIRVILSNDFDITSVKEIIEPLKDEYPKVETTKRSGVDFGFNKGERVVKAEDVEIFGYRLWSGDKTQVVLMTSEGFTFSRLSPYSNWEIFEGEAKRLLDIYLDQVSPLSITRLAVRYINKLEIKQEKINLSEILTAPPSIPKDLAINIEGFLNRIIIKDVESDCRAIVTQAPSSDMSSGYPSIILDIDAFYEKRDGIDTSEIWSIINKLRMFKNDIFFKSITDNQLEAYK
jgi:uncharacterized protein (TIGR04255 family)